MARIAQSRSCKFCGHPGLLWRAVQGPRGLSIRLVNPIDGSIHRCAAYGMKQRPGIGQADKVEPEKPIIEPEPIEPIVPEVKHVEAVWDGKHKSYNALQVRVEIGLNVLLVGPAGSGKTHAAEQVAESLKLKFYPQSVGPQTSKSDLIGYMDAHGKLVRTVLREAYEHGGVYLLDEIDAGNAGVLTVLNALLANSVCSFPDGVIRKHADFRCIAAANTYGQGANRQYVGRQQLDAATLDRFVGLDWDYDKRLECELGKSQPDWTLYVWSLRKASEKLGIKRVFGTRRIQQGTKMLDAGVSLSEVKKETVYFGVSIDEVKKLEANL